MVALTEIEDVVDVVSNNYVGERSSGGVASYTSDYVTIASGLPSGQYKLLARATSGSSSRTLTFKCGSTTLYNPTMTASSGTLSDYVSDWFELTGASNTIEGIVQSGTNSRMDYVYVQRRCETISDCDNLGYTYSSTLPLDFTGKNVEAYTAAYNSTTEKVELSRVYKVPANTGLFIKGSADDIPVLTGDADAMGTNNLIAVSATTTVNQTEGDNTNFVLGVDNASAPTAAVFLKAPTAGVSVSAGKAYLQIPTASVPATARMNIVFEDEATGISDATHLNENGKMTNANYYDLSGRRVAQPTKGLYIVNGKKVVIK